VPKSSVSPLPSGVILTGIKLAEDPSIVITQNVYSDCPRQYVAWHQILSNHQDTPQNTNFDFEANPDSEEELCQVLDHAAWSPGNSPDNRKDS
jgi:hypothetical protein